MGDGRVSRGWKGQWEMGGAVGDGRGSSGWEGQWEMGGGISNNNRDIKALQGGKERERL